MLIYNLRSKFTALELGFLVSISQLEYTECALTYSQEQEKELKNDNIEYRHLIERSNIQHIITA